MYITRLSYFMKLSKCPYMSYIYIYTMNSNQSLYLGISKELGFKLRNQDFYGKLCTRGQVVPVEELARDPVQSSENGATSVVCLA